MECNLEEQENVNKQNKMSEEMILNAFAGDSANNRIECFQIFSIFVDISEKYCFFLFSFDLILKTLRQKEQIRCFTFN